MEDILGKSLRKGEQEFATNQVVGINEQKFVGIYFGAHWAPPCRLFTSNLVEAYKQINEQGQYFEVVFVSLDGNDAAFEKNFAEMPWLGVPYKEEDLRSRLKQRFGINAIPSIVILDAKTGAMVADEGRFELQTNVESALEIWEKKLEA